MSLYAETVHDGTCTNCGHRFNARCSRCLRGFCCGGMAVRCPEPDCNDGVIEHHVDQEYAQWLRSHYEAYPAVRASSGNLEDPRPDADYPLKSEVHPDDQVLA